mmetsp:Transcript_13460/g.13522  ORF Transcript_13460/g.13522 Transcript_13460/m.13522 type:complete len:580 (+) Transcript_13460:71-1810(+)
MKKFFAVIYFILNFFLVIECCKFFDVQSDAIGSHRFYPLPHTVSEQAGVTNGRTAFATSEGKALFLYHVMVEPATEGIARWVINDQLGSATSAIAFIDSWAILPHLIADVNDVDNDWMLSTNQEWAPDENFNVYCVFDDEIGIETDSTIYFESSEIMIPLSGYYVEATVDKEIISYDGPIFAQIKAVDEETQLYMYQSGDKWIIGDITNVGKDSGVAFVIDQAVSPSLIKSHEWNFVINGTWYSEYAVVIAGTPDSSVVTALREHRSIRYIPKGQRVAFLRNNIVMPLVGLGTGALAKATANNVIDKALQLGYRSLDLAREYDNEEDVYNILVSYQLKEEEEREKLQLPYRSDMFLITKVWPTELGFEPTSSEILRSMEALHSTYIDMYFLHWPSCNPEVSWMHCETTVDPEGNWIESWHALEKAYAEGRVNSIGVSNFNIELLQHMEDIATVLPHAVQNFAQIGEMDLDVRMWCAEHNVIYQPYASQRHMENIPAHMKPIVKKIAADHNVSIQVLSLRYFIQTGATVIPRSSNEQHLKENLEIFDWELSEEEMKALGWDFPMQSLESEELEEDKEESL